MALRDILDEYGELLPLAEEQGGGLFAFNAWTVDALDETSSSLTRVPGTNHIIGIEKPIFFTERIHDRYLFRLPGRAMPTYVSERFVELVRRAGLVGLDFEPVATIS